VTRIPTPTLMISAGSTVAIKSEPVRGNDTATDGPEPRAWLHRLCLLTGTAFTGKDGNKYGNHDVFGRVDDSHGSK